MKRRTVLFVGSMALLSCLLLSSCLKKEEGVAVTTNTEIRLVLLFQHDGIKVYRFYDGGRSIYYTDARGATQWSEYHSTGKSGYTTTERVETTR